MARAPKWLKAEFFIGFFFLGVALYALMDVAIDEASAGVSPAGFIYHLPRSGSTLVARMLTGLESCACIVEPEAINALLSRPEARVAFKPEWLRRLIQLYGVALDGRFHHVFVKLSSWAILHAPVFADAFPGTPGCFIHRDPVDVLVQLLERPTGWMSKSARSFILGHTPAETMSLEEYCARALERFCEAAIHAGPRVRAVAYEDVPAIVPALAQDHFGLDVLEAATTALTDIAQYDSEDWSVQRRYVEPIETLRARVTPLALHMTERFAQNARRRLLASGPR